VKAQLDVGQLPNRIVPLDSLTPHPDNYRVHPEDQIADIMASLSRHGQYRPVVISTDEFILAGHGVVDALAELGAVEVWIAEAPYLHTDSDAINLVIADNTLSLFAQDDDRALSELLKRLKDEDTLEGTGFNEQSLAALVMVTRPASEIADFDAAAEWVGMPDFEHAPELFEMKIVCESEDDRREVAERLGYGDTTVRKGKRVWTGYWPPREQDDPGSILFDA